MRSLQPQLIFLVVVSICSCYATDENIPEECGAGYETLTKRTFYIANEDAIPPPPSARAHADSSVLQGRPGKSGAKGEAGEKGATGSKVSLNSLNK